jgi:hypothetical protein
MPKKPPAPVKEKFQRIQEAVELLKNLQAVGISSHDSGYLAVKVKIDKWIVDGEAWNGRIDIPRYGRYAEMILPTRADRKCTMVLRATEELKQQVLNDES